MAIKTTQAQWNRAPQAAKKGMSSEPKCHGLPQSTSAGMSQPLTALLPSLLMKPTVCHILALAVYEDVGLYYVRPLFREMTGDARSLAWRLSL